MIPPGTIYCLTLAGVAGLSAPVNRLAWVVIAAWVPGQIAWLSMLPTAPVDMVMDILAIGIGAAFARNAIDLFVTAMFVPMAVLNMADGIGSISPYYAWWMLFWMGMIQIIVLPFGNDWSKIGGLLRRLRHGPA